MKTAAFKCGMKVIRWQKTSINAAVVALQLSLKHVLSTTYLPPLLGALNGDEV